MPGSAVRSLPDPALRGDFGLISVEDRVLWREVLPRRLLGSMCQADGSPLSALKVEEQIGPTLATIQELLNNDPLATLLTLEEYFSPNSLAHRSDYAS